MTTERTSSGRGVGAFLCAGGCAGLGIWVATAVGLTWLLLLVGAVAGLCAGLGVARLLDRPGTQLRLALLWTAAGVLVVGLASTASGLVGSVPDLGAVGGGWLGWLLPAAVVFFLAGAASPRLAGVDTEPSRLLVSGLGWAFAVAVALAVALLLGYVLDALADTSVVGSKRAWFVTVGWGVTGALSGWVVALLGRVATSPRVLSAG